MIALWLHLLPFPASLSGCAAPVDANELSSTRAIDARALHADIDSGKAALLIDVRTPGEYTAGHVASAVNIPINELANRLSEIEGHKDSEIYLICEVGGRSAAASKLLASRGFRPVDVRDGMGGWRSQGFPVEGTPR